MTDRIEIRTGKYKLKKGQYKISNITFKLYGKELIIGAIIALLLLIQFYAFYDIFPQEYFIVNVLFLLFCNILLNLLWVNAYYYNKKNPEKKSSDFQAIFLIIILINENFAFAVIENMEDISFSYSQNGIYLFNLCIAFFILSIVAIRIIKFKLKKKKDSTLKRPTIVFYFTSAFTISFSSLSILSVASHSIVLLYFLNLIFALLILLVLMVKKLFHRIALRKKRFRNIYSQIVFIAVICIYIILISFLILIVFGSTVNYYVMPDEIFELKFEEYGQIWNFSSLFLNLFVSLACSITALLFFKDRDPLFIWEDIMELNIKINE